MAKKRAYAFTYPCRACNDPVTATFFITDEQAVRVKTELDANPSFTCVACAAKADAIPGDQGGTGTQDMDDVTPDPLPPQPDPAPATP